MANFPAGPGQCQPAIASLSLGRAVPPASHTIESKLSAAAFAGIKGIEVFYEDLEALAEIQSEGDGSITAENKLLRAADVLRSLADKHDLQIIALQPFMHYEGLVDARHKDAAWQRLKLWFKLAKVLRTDLIQVPSNFLPETEAEITGDRSVIVRDLQRLADAGKAETPPIRFAYENICWGSFIYSWKQLWEVVVAVDRTNFGICLDTFHLTGSEFADPTAEKGMISDDASATFKANMEELVRTIDVSKVFYVQTADALQPESPLTPEYEFWTPGYPARLSWSRNMRVFAFEQGGYMPVRDALEAALAPAPKGLGYKGWVSAEVFSRSLWDAAADVPQKHAERAMQSWRTIQNIIG